jgi:hypothetical protein
MEKSRTAARARATVIASASAALIVGAPVGAQQQTRVVVTGGFATDQRGVQSRAVSVVPGLVLVSKKGTTLSIDADVTRYASEVWSVGAGAVLAERDHLAGPFTLTLDGSAGASRIYASGTSATFYTGDMAPAIEFAVGTFSIFGGGRAAAGRIEQNAQRMIVPPNGNGSPANNVRVTRTGFGPSVGATITSSPSAGEMFSVSGRQDRLIVSDVQVTDIMIEATLAGQGASFTGNIGSRKASDEDGSFGGATLNISVTPSVYFTATAGRFPSGRLTGTPAGNYLSAGFTFGSTPSPRREGPFLATRAQ